MRGRQNVANALAASASAKCAGATLEEIAAGLRKTLSVSGRMKPFQGLNQSLLIDDSYNANPSSVLAAASVLKDFQRQGREAILVLGDMAELGGSADLILHDLGLDLQELGFKQLLTVGTVSAHVARGFTAQKENDQSVTHFAEQNEAIDFLKTIMTKNTVVLVKGSRSAHMEKIVHAITLAGELI